MVTESPYLALLKDRINMNQIPFSERGSRLMVFRKDDYLSIRLAERWFKREGQLAAYRQRPPLVDHIRFTDANGTALPFELDTYPHRFDCKTACGVFSITYVDTETILIALPVGKCGLTFKANLDLAQTDRRGGILRLTGDIRRNISYTTNAQLIDNRVEAVDAQNQRVHLIFDSGGGASLMLNITPRLGFNRWVPEAEAALEASARRWHDWFAAAPPVAEKYQAQYYYAWWIMRAGLISSRFYTTREAMTPSKTHYVGVWQWDAYFHALAYRHVDMGLAKDQIRVVLDHQREDGMIPDAIHDEGTVTRLDFPVEADVTKPPLLAWAVWKLFEMDRDAEFLDEIYEPIVRWNRWWFEKNDVDGNGLCEYQHPYSSGLDDSPLWDDGVPVEAPDLNTYLCLQQESLSKIAGAIGEPTEARVWAERADAMARRMIDNMWDEQAGVFWAWRPAETGRMQVRVLTPFNLLPLITGRMPAQINSRLVDHLTNEDEFWSRYPVPTVARNDPKYDPLKMWRGPTWVNVNYLLVEGLTRAGYRDLARELRLRTLDMMLECEDICEFYHPETGQTPPTAASVFGWSSALFIEMAIEESLQAAQKP